MRARKYTQKIKLQPSSLRSYGLMDQTGSEIENDTEMWKGESSIRIRKKAKGLEWKDLCPGCNLCGSVLSTPVKTPWGLLDSPSKTSQATYNGPQSPTWPGSAPWPHHLAPSAMLSCLQPLWSLLKSHILSQRFWSQGHCNDCFLHLKFLPCHPDITNSLISTKSLFKCGHCSNGIICTFLWLSNIPFGKT